MPARIAAKGVLLGLGRLFEHPAEVLQLSADHLVHAVDKPHDHGVQKPQLILAGHGHEVLQALVHRLDGILNGAGDVFGKRAVQIPGHRLDQRRLLLLVDRDLRQRVDAEHAGIAAHGAVERPQRVLGRAVDGAGNQCKQDRSDHAEDRRHERIAHAGDQHHDRLLRGGGVGHVEAGQTLRQSDQRAQKAQRHQQARHRVAKCAAPGAVDDGLLVDEVLDVAGVVVFAIGEEEVVQIGAPVGLERSLAEEVVLLPGALGLVAGLDAADGGAQPAARADHGRDAQHQSHDEHRHDDDVDEQTRQIRRRGTEQRLQKFHAHLHVSKFRSIQIHSIR